jgi:hypothetical protein
MDRTYNDALVLSDADEQQIKSRQRTKTTVETMSAPTFAFHRRYVLDVSKKLIGTTNQREQFEKISKEVAREKSWTGNSELRASTHHPNKYVVKQLSGKGQQRPSLFLRSIRGLVLLQMDQLLVLQESENANLKLDY